VDVGVGLHFLQVSGPGWELNMAHPGGKPSNYLHNRYRGRWIHVFPAPVKQKEFK